MDIAICISNLKEIITRFDPAIRATADIDDTLSTFFDDLADVQTRISSPSARITTKTKYLLWHMQNLKPAVKAQVETAIHSVWKERRPLPVPLAPGDSVPAPDRSETEDGKVENRESSLTASPPPPLKPLDNRRAPASPDWFDRLLDMVAGLVSGLSLKGW